MIEQIGEPGQEGASNPTPNATTIIEALFAGGNEAPVVAEIGVGIGASALVMAALLDNRGALHLYDDQAKVEDLVRDLAAIGFNNALGFGHTDQHWDSSAWTLGRMIQHSRLGIYDYIHIGGTQTFAVDALALVLCDRLLKPGGYLELADPSETDEPTRAAQVKTAVDLFLNDNAGYAAVQPNRLYRKAGGGRDAVSVRREPAAAEAVTWRGQNFRVIPHAAVASALAEFRSPFEAGTLQFFDAALPACDKMIDVGAYVGLMSLYSAGRVREVCAFEASPTNFNLLAQNIAVNDDLRGRIKLFSHGLGDRDERVPLYGKAHADSGSSIFRTVERGGVINGTPEATVELRDANTVLRSIGVTRRTLLKIDIEGAEYLVVPAIAALLAEVKPFLHLSFHPFNLVAGNDEYLNTVTRIRRAMQIAEALAHYRFMYCYEQDQWHCIQQSDRMLFLREYLLRSKPVPRIHTPQFGFIDAVGFADVELPALGCAGSATPLAIG